MEAEIGYGAALLGGIVSFLSPCVLPLVPGYLCFVAGASLDELAGADTPPDAAMRARALTAALAFVLGFSTVFVLLGASATALTQQIVPHLDVISQIAGGVIVIFGLHYMGVFRIPFLNREARFNPEGERASLVSAYLIGLAFAFGWTPCVGPILAAILALAGTSSSVGQGMSLLAVYSLGLGLPFLLAALGLGRFMSVMKRLRPHMGKIEKGAGVLLVATGVLIAFGSLGAMSYWLIETFPALGKIG
ncbi:MAG: cytochrome c biogenesis CcdA family protein [Alphaproteobacteria bacterium]